MVMGPHRPTGAQPKMHASGHRCNGIVGASMRCTAQEWTRHRQWPWGDGTSDRHWIEATCAVCGESFQASSGIGRCAHLRPTRPTG